MKKNQAGVSLVEILLVIVVVVALAMLVANLPRSISLVSRSQHTSVAKDVANKRMTTLKTTAYSSLSNGTSTFTDPQLSSLAGAQASFTVADCPISVCTNGEVMKKISVTITWKESGEDKEVVLTSLVTDGGVGK